jgi:hypothetical protein
MDFTKARPFLTKCKIFAKSVIRRIELPSIAAETCLRYERPARFQQLLNLGNLARCSDRQR